MSKNRDDVLNVIPDPRVRTTLARLHALADSGETALKLRLAPFMPRLLMGKTLPWETLEHRFDEDFIAIGREDGVHAYLLARALNARHIVEFGTSFGVSTIYLACAVRDNGGGRVIGTERVVAKAQRARRHLEEAGVAEWAEVRGGDAPGSLADLSEPIDMLFNDGFPQYALPVLQAVAPKMHKGAMVLSGNAAVFAADHREYLDWVRDPANGFLSTRLALGGGVELSVRVR